MTANILRELALQIGVKPDWLQRHSRCLKAVTIAPPQRRQPEGSVYILNFYARKTRRDYCRNISKNAVIH